MKVLKKATKGLSLAMICYAFAITTANASSTNTNAVFSCTTTNNKQLYVADTGKGFFYRFGKAKKPELSFNVARHQAEFNMGETGRYKGRSLSLPRGNFVYSVFLEYDSMEQIFTSGVRVFKNDDLIATVPCKTHTLIENLGDMD